MRPAFADFSPTVPAAFAAGIGISLSVFLLPAGVAQKGPTPVLPAYGGAAGRVAADLPVARASKIRKAASAYPQIVVALRPPTTTARQVHHRARTVVVPRTPSAPVRAVARAARKTPVTRDELFGIPPRGKGKARGHGPKSQATPTPLPPGHGKGLGRSNEDQDRLPPGLAKKTPRASAPGLAPRPESKGGGNGRKGKGGGNGRKGNGGGNGRKGNGGGNEDKGNGGGNGRKWEND
ncbi:MAG: hypothetical protein ACTHNB_03350 [Gaiellaceae bacterium]